MNRKELSDGIELFCNSAPIGASIARFCPEPGIDIFCWFFESGTLAGELSENFDFYLYKEVGELIPIGRFSRYITDGKFDKALYLNPDGDNVQTEPESEPDAEPAGKFDRIKITRPLDHATDGKGNLCNATFAGSACDCEIVGDGTLPYPLKIQYCAKHNAAPELLDACITAHDSLLCLHVCDQDRGHASTTRQALQVAIGKAKPDAEVTAKPNTSNFTIELMLSRPQIDKLKAATEGNGEPPEQYEMFAQVIFNGAINDLSADKEN